MSTLLNFVFGVEWTRFLNATVTLILSYRDFYKLVIIIRIISSFQVSFWETFSHRDVLFILREICDCFFFISTLLLLSNSYIVASVQNQRSKHQTPNVLLIV